MSFAFLAVTLIALWLALLGIRERELRGAWWVPAMVAAELAPWFLLGLAAMTGLSVVAGWTGGVAGAAGLAAALSAGVLFGWAANRARLARPAIEAGLADLLGAPVLLPRIAFRRRLRPYPPLPGPYEMETFAYGPHERHRVDRIARPDVHAGPVLIHIHGGGWWRGRPGRQARPLIHRMASMGWVVLTPTYRLSPEATFPDHLDDIQRLLTWVRESAPDLRADTGFIAVAGGSAGGQLAALAGFGSGAADLILPIYGVHDLLGPDGISEKWPYLRTEVMKSDPRTDREAWKRASPARSVTADRPPFLVVHGSADWVVDPVESQSLVDAMRAVGGPPVGHIEVPYANHGFDFFASVRSLLLAEGIAVALEALNTRRLQRAEGA
jgi:acetyl esterase/lipase